MGVREGEGDRERDPLIFTPKRVRFPLRKELKEKTVRQQRPVRSPGRGAGGARGEREAGRGESPAGRGVRAGRPRARSPPRAAVEPWLCSAARRAPVSPPGSERSLPPPLPPPPPDQLCLRKL